jgi:ribosomal protein L12E/L44/L45/RPP1/RPP2
MAPNCPKKPKVNCYVCSEEGYLARDCPNKAGPSEPKKEDTKGKKASTRKATVKKSKKKQEESDDDMGFSLFD